MATTVTKMRTNYFAVKDKKAFAGIVEKMVTNDGKAFMFENSRGEVGFAADGLIFGVMPDESSREFSKETLEDLKIELFDYGNDEIEKFVGTSVDGWEKDTIDRFLDEVIEQKSKAELTEAIKYYLGLDNPEPDEMETEMIHQIQALIEPGHACIITDISYENLKCLTGNVLIITYDHSNAFSLNDVALEKARTMLKDEHYNPDMCY